MTIQEKILAEVINRSVAETFEGMAFIVINPEENAKKDNDLLDDQWMWARVDVHEPIQAEFIMVLSKIFAKEIVEVLFGEIEEGEVIEPGNGKTADVLKEIVNTMVGRCMNKLVAENESFSLGLPLFGEGWPKKNDDVLVYRFSTDEGNPLAVVVDVKSDMIAAVEGR